MSETRKIGQIFQSVCGIEYVAHTLRIRHIYATHTQPHTVTHTFTRQEALQGRFWKGVAMLVSPGEKRAVLGQRRTR